MLLASALGVLAQSLLSALCPQSVQAALQLCLAALLLLSLRFERALAFALGGCAIVLLPAAPPLATDAEDWPMAVEGFVARVLPAEAEYGPMLRLHSGLLLRVPRIGALPPVGALVRARGILAGTGRSLRCTVAPKVLDPAPSGFTPTLLRLSERMGERIARGLSSADAHLLRALLLGDSSIDPERRERLVLTGTLHFFAISGMHLVLLMALAQRAIGRHRFLLLLLITTYAALCGFAVPIQRAFISTALFLLAGLLQRPACGQRHWWLALAAVLLGSPRASESPGFWLTFAATAGILWGARARGAQAADGAPLRHMQATRTASVWQRLITWIADNLRVTLCATCASAPVTVVFFRQLTPAAIMGSLLLAPVVTVLMILALAKLVFPDLALLGGAIKGSLHALDTTLLWLEQVPCGNVPVATPALTAWIGVFAACVLLAAARTRFAPLLACALVHCALLMPASTPLRVVLLHNAAGGAVIDVREANTHTGHLIHGKVTSADAPTLRQVDVLRVVSGAPDAQAPRGGAWPRAVSLQAAAHFAPRLGMNFGLFEAGGMLPLLRSCPRQLGACSTMRKLADAAMAAAAGTPLQNARRGKPLVFEQPAATW